MFTVRKGQPTLTSLLLMHLFNRGPLTPNMLAKLTRENVKVLTRILHNLEKRGITRRLNRVQLSPYTVPSVVWGLGKYPGREKYRLCFGCGVIHRQPRAIYCSARCRNRTNRRKWQEKQRELNAARRRFEDSLPRTQPRDVPIPVMVGL